MAEAALLTVLIPLAAAVIAWVLPRAAAAVGLVAAAGVVAAVAAVTLGVASEGPVNLVAGAWPAGLGIRIWVDGAGVVFLLASALVGLAATVHARDYFARGTGFWTLWLLLWAALNGVFITGDAFNAYVALELAGLAAAALVTLDGSRPALVAGLRYLMVSLAGATAYLGGVALLYTTTGTLDLAALSAAAPEGPVTGAAGGLILTGLMLKAALFPLHTWLPPAHSRAPGPVSAVLSALVVKAALFLAWRWLAVLPSPAAGTEMLAVLGAAAVLWGSVQALRVGRLKGIIAYSTVAQMGFLAMGLALAGDSPQAATGVAYLALTHALAKGAAFLGAANVMRAAGHDRWPLAAAGLRGRPLTLMAFVLAAVSLAGLPPSGGFVAKWYLLQEALSAGRFGLGLLFLGGGLLSAAYLYRILQPGLDPRPPAVPDRPPSRAMEWAALGLGLAVTALGVAASWAQPLVGAGPVAGPGS